MSAPQAAQLQHPISSIGTEYQFDSLKPMTTLTVTASITGTLSAADPGGSGLTNTVTYSGTLTSTLSRVDFIPRDYYPDMDAPDSGEFFLVSDCCCWKCRWQIIQPLEGLEPTGSIDWDSTWTGTGAPSPASGSLDPELSLLEGYITAGVPPGGDGYAAFLVQLRRALCHEAGETDRLGQIVQVFFPALAVVPGNGFNMPPLTWVLTTTAGGDSGTTPDDPLPVMKVESESCGDSVTVTAELEMNGTETIGGVTSTVTALTYSTSFTLS